jgi:ParB-like chromosome segregation protein Spo0J
MDENKSNENNDNGLITPMTKEDRKRKKVKWDKTIKYVKTSSLKPHSKNEKIYGNEDVSNLVALIKECGEIIDSLVINQDNVIISGHRRWSAAQKLNIETLPCEVINTLSEEEELELLIQYNASREKTFEQRIREGMTLEEVYKAKAKKRSLSNLKQNKPDSTDMGELNISEESAENGSPKGITRDIVAKDAGIPSGTSYERGKKVIEVVDKLRGDGNEEDASLLLTILDKSASAAKDLALNAKFLISLTEDTKNDLKRGKISVRSILPKEKHTKQKKKSTNEYALAKEHIKVIKSASKALCKIKLSEKDNDNVIKIREELEIAIGNIRKYMSSELS